MSYKLGMAAVIMQHGGCFMSHWSPAAPITNPREAFNVEGKFSFVLCAFKQACLYNCAGRFTSLSSLNREAGYVDLSITKN